MDADKDSDESTTKQDETPWSFEDTEKAVLAIILVSVAWIVVMMASGDMQQQYAHAGDALGAVAAVLSVGATYFAVHGLNLQRVALKDQRESFASQLKAQQDAVAEDHRRQHLARLQEAYAEAMTKLQMFAFPTNAAIEVVDTMPDRSGVLSIQAAGRSLDERLVDTVVACARVEFLDHNKERIAAVEYTLGAFAAAHERLGNLIRESGPSDLDKVDLDCEELAQLLAQSIRDEMLTVAAR